MFIANASRCVCTYGQSANPRSACLLICCIACWERAISRILGSFRFAIRLLRPFRTGFCGNVFVYYIEKCLLIYTSSLVTWAIVLTCSAIGVCSSQFSDCNIKPRNFSVCKWKLTFLKKKLCWQKQTKLDIPFACAGCQCWWKLRGIELGRFREILLIKKMLQQIKKDQDG